MKKCSRCRKEKPYLIKCEGLNWAGLEYRKKDFKDYKVTKEKILKPDPNGRWYLSQYSKIISLLLCSDCILNCDLAIEGCGHCDMKCSFNCHCPTWMDNMDKKFEMEVNNAERKT